jgi:hypothetical protein
MLDRLTSLICRIFFIVAFVMLVIAVWDKIIGYYGFTVSFIGEMGPARLLELAVTLMIFVIGLLLRQIREGLRSKS